MKLQLKQRYWRKTIDGEGLRHHGDCQFFDIQICTCGLLHDISGYPNEDPYEEFEIQLIQHDENIEAIQKDLED